MTFKIGDKVRVSVSPDYTPREVDGKTAVVTAPKGYATYWTVRFDPPIEGRYADEEFLFTDSELTKIEETAVFKPGDRVRVTDGPAADKEYWAGVKTGDQGEVVSVSENPNDQECPIRVKFEDGWAWNMHADHLELTTEKTAELSVGDHAEIVDTALVGNGLLGRVGLVTSVYQGPIQTEVVIEVRHVDGQRFSQTVYVDHLKKTDAPVTFSGPVEATVVPELSDLTVGTKVKILSVSSPINDHVPGETGTVVDGHGATPPAGKVWVNVEGKSRPGHGWAHSPKELEIIEEAPAEGFYVGQPIPVGSDMFDRLPVGTVIDLLNEPESTFYREKRDSGWTHEDVELRIDGKDLFQEYKVKSLPEGQAEVEDYREVLDTTIEDFFKALFEAPRDTEVVADRKDEEPVVENTPENPFPVGTLVEITQDYPGDDVAKAGDTARVVHADWLDSFGRYTYDIEINGRHWPIAPKFLIEADPEPKFPVGTRVMITEDDAHGAPVSKGDLGTVELVITEADNSLTYMVRTDHDGEDWYFSDRTLTLAPAPVETVAETVEEHPSDVAARDMGRLYKSLMDNGFDRDQAFTLVLNIADKAIK